MGSDSESEDKKTPDQHVYGVGLKLPPLWKNNIKLWFIRIESNFALSKISADETKYNNVIASIDPETLTAVSDILLKPPATGKYTALKERLIEEYSDSATQQIRRLLSEIQLGDDKPSHLLRKMRELANGSLNDEFLQTLWLQRLPSDIQSILSVSSETLDNLAKLADKIAEVRSEASVCAVSYAAAEKPSRDHSARALAGSSAAVDGGEISALRAEVAALSKQMSRLLTRVRSHSRPPRGKSPHSRNGSQYKRNFCFYHRKFGKNAHKCIPPCTFSESENSEN